MTETSVSDLEAFLSYLGEKGLLTPAAAASRRAATGKVFGVLSDNEREDVFSLDLEQVVGRFTNLHGKEYKPGSLQAYVSRVRASLDDFRRYVDDPVNFKMTKSTAPKQSKGAGATAKNVKTQTDDAEAAPQASATMPALETVFPIPIRDGVVVKIYGLPFDLTESEANKISAVIKAMAL